PLPFYPTDTGVSTQADDEEGDGEGEGEEDIRADISKDLKITKEKKEIVVKKKKKKKKKWYSICLNNCKYDVVRRVSRKFGFRDVADDEDWTLYWTDYSVALERVMDMKKYQKINHFPGMSEICRKDLLARNLNRMMKMFPKEYSVFPKTWCLPADYGDFQAYTRQKKNKTYILKPESGCQGKGIWVTKNPKEVKAHEHMICQVYLNRPLLIDGFKFDLRIYVLITSCDPLRLYVFKDGLARFATNKYTEPNNNNVDNVYMHLTNYAINKHSEDFVRDDEAGSKRRISTINRYMHNKGYDIDKLWSDIDDVIIKTVISAHSVLKHNYRTCFPNHVKGSACFEILGVDILLDKKLRPYILEVNHSPSFNTDSELDREIKGALVWDTLHLVNFGACDRRKCIEEEKKRIKDRLLGRPNKKESKEELEQAQAVYIESLERYENNHMGNFRRIYPYPGCEKYDKFFNSSGTLFQETAAFKARSELARQQREEISRKKQKMESMLKGKRSLTGLRPESPGSRRRRTLRRQVLPNRRPSLSRNSHDQNYSHDTSRGFHVEPIDTSKPLDILEDEELERISGLLQRDNLVRGLGIVEHVYRLLHCTPGTMGIMKGDPRPLPPPMQDSQRWLYHNRPLDACLAGRQAPIRIKDRQYYKKLLDRYFGHNHALAHEHSAKERALPKNSFTNPHYALSKQGSSSHMRDDGNRHFPQVRLSYSTSERKVVLTHEPNGTSNMEAGTEEIIDLESETTHRSSQNTSLLDSSQSVHSASTTLSHLSSAGPRANSNIMPPPNPLANQTLFHSTSNLSTRLVPLSQSSAHLSTQPSHGRWQSKSGSLSSLNEKTVPSYQRSKYTRKPLGASMRNTGSATVVPDNDFRNLSLAETEAERNRILARNGYAQDWQSDTSAPTFGIKRTMSAHSQRKEGDLPRVASNQGTQGLSVVSAPAPVIQRPDLVKPKLLSPNASSFRHVSQNRGSAESYLRGQRSTRTQRIRGASNNVRLRQLEMRENHAVVYS
ncbi:hypothetical protein ScPMuIL_018635, partial [Solemya velum]